MVKTVIGDLFASQAQALGNPVNCVGVMGKGLALEFKGASRPCFTTTPSGVNEGRSGSNHHQQPHVVPLNRLEFVRLVRDPRVVGQGDPSPLPNRVQPLLVRAVVSLEVIADSLDGESGVPEDLAELQAEISVREIDDTQAARS